MLILFYKLPRLALPGLSLGRLSVITAGPPEPKPQHPFHPGTPATKPEFHTYLQAAEWVSRDASEWGIYSPMLIT